LRKEGHHDILKDPSKIYNRDESGFTLSPNTGFFLAPKGASHVYYLNRNTRTQITFLISASSSGHVPAQLIIFRGKRFSSNTLLGVEEAFLGLIDDWCFTATFVHMVD